MEIRARLLASGEKTVAREIAIFVSNNPEHLPLVIDCFVDENKRLCQRTLWVILYIGEANPHLLDDYLPKLIQHLPIAKSDTQVRNILRLFELLDIPENDELEGYLYEYANERFCDPNCATAIRVFSLTVLYKVGLRYPELQPELITAIELYQNHGTVGFKHRCKVILSKLKALVS